MKSIIIQSRRISVHYPTTKLVVDSLYTKNELSILYICGGIFEEKVWRERKRNNTGKNKQETAYS